LARSLERASSGGTKLSTSWTPICGKTISGGSPKPVSTWGRRWVRGQLELRRWQDAQLRGDRFDQDAMLALIEEVLESGAASGYPLTRFVAHMEWALLDKPGVDDLIEFETRVNYVLPKYDDPVICTYDLSKFSASVVMDIMRTHPVVIIGEVLQENPFFVPPDQFLLEIRERRRFARAR
jgi:hypothetical protein